ncbi:MAG: hypothetical protein QGH73_18790 [Rhodospirillales bacterium]|jgi:hypothetical protein|nr:hypothetical protein [Rhodospirillaceae bacterium]MDP6426991.1 hypothetical protein [Rhodospirillales bacterium]MDP6644647.1 hypothetical protein [Rhodospirillales bacterium]MDP6843722.1 hypothetical protein [Rhodospirillales bacterium]|tara:strand:- start:888 stop:1613 length:726 start_codon:yes stop_codon:yes gene_type:complete
MAVTEVQLSVLAQLRERLPEAPRLLSLGYPDILADVSRIEDLFGPEVSSQLRFRDDGAEIIAWHGLTGELERIPESTAFFDSLGISCTVIDIAASRGGERIVDLNGDLPDDLAGAFDIVLDPGTIEHCFNIGGAMMNIASSLGAGGFVCHFAPLSMFNHGFFNLNPTFFHDFFTQNGFEIVLLKGVAGPLLAPRFFDIPPTGRFQEPPGDASILVVARRPEIGPLNWPVQTKYLDNPDLKA